MPSECFKNSCSSSKIRADTHYLSAIDCIEHSCSSLLSSCAGMCPFMLCTLSPSSSKGRLNLFKAGKVRGKMTWPWLSWKLFLLVCPWWPGCTKPLTSVEAEKALVAYDLLETVNAVLVHQLFHEGTWRTLVLHAGLHQVDGVHGSGTHRCRERKCVLNYVRYGIIRLFKE